MNYIDVLRIIVKMLNGVNPVTDARLPSDNIIMHPTIQHALSIAAKPLATRINSIDRQWTPRKSRMHWSPLEDSKLIDGYKDGVRIDVLARYHQRTERSIRDRLNILGLYPYMEHQEQKKVNLSTVNRLLKRRSIIIAERKLAAESCR